MLLILTTQESRTADGSLAVVHRGSQPLAFDGICGIRGVLLEIDRDLVDLHRLEASNGNVQALLDDTAKLPTLLRLE